MVATFVIFLREGIEGSLIIAILLAYLSRQGQRRHFRDIYAGVGAALALVAGGGAAAFILLRSYAGSRVQTIFETCTYLVAAVVLTYMTFWMQSHSSTISAELKAKVDGALSGRTRAGLGLVAFQAVGREGLETMVFTLAIAFSATGRQGMAVGGSKGPDLALGAALGLALALGVAFVIYRLGHRLRLTAFFSTVGVLLMIFAAGLLVDSVENLQQLGWLPFLSHPLWSTSALLSEDSTGGDILHSLFGYADQPTYLQAIVYLAYLSAAVAGFTWLRRRRSRAPLSATR